MASMVFASSPLSAQSLVKLRTNSNYPRSSYYVPLHSKTNSYVDLSYNISHIESSKSSFTKGDGFSKFPRVASTLSPSLNIIKACMGDRDIYIYNARKLKQVPQKLGQKNQDSVVSIPTRLTNYKGKVLLIVNIPQQGSEWSELEINYLNDLRQEYHLKGFEVLGFLYDKNELDKKQEYGGIFAGFRHGKKKLDEELEILKILDKATFPIFEKVKLNKQYKWFTKGEPDSDLWYFLRNTYIRGEQIKKIKEDFEKFLVNRQGIPIEHYLRFDYETSKPQDVQDGGHPGPSAGLRPDPSKKIKNDIDRYFEDR